MNNRELALYNFLNEQDINPRLYYHNCRRIVQEAVYKHGDHLGYTFGKYIFGMYSPELWDVHIDLNNTLVLEAD